ncbi:MAG: PEP/pyruvate-binding domain-containing protein, partial [Dissulfurimicrobium sp.]
MDREIFTSLMKRHKDLYSVQKKREFSGAQMMELAMAYRNALLDHGLLIEEDPFEQLLAAVRMVKGSWDSDKARAYREIMGLSDYWGTAIIVQAMAYGNLSESSGTGVVFTANPKRKLDRVSLWGDFTPGNQGEDIVSGLVTTYPISVEQKEILGLDSEMTLEEAFPEIYNALLDLSNHLIYKRKWSHQEIEFTFEGPERDKLYILQTRNMSTKKHDALAVFIKDQELDASYLGRGIGVSGGALSGKAVFSMAEIEAFRAREPDTPLIFIRSDTVPDDIKEISLSQGLLTAKGGQTSHAAIVAFGLDKVCVVGCKQLKVFESEGLANINGKVIHSGDYISIDGRKGMVYLGRHPVLMRKG